MVPRQKRRAKNKNNNKNHNTNMASELDQFADLELSKEDRDQIFEPPSDRPPIIDDAR